jgi:EmrB/QacA subfamily drug resistance transporter
MSAEAAPRKNVGWTFAITSIVLFMAALDNLVVTTALPVIRADLGASLSQLEWIVNAYTLTFAVLLLTGAALGDRFGRRRVFVAGIILFTLGSAFAAMSSSTEVLIIARALQGIGGAIITPLTLTILSSAVSPERRALALGAWGGIGGLAVAIGPVVGGAIAEGLSWQWIFWINVPIGIAAAAFAAYRLNESLGPDRKLDLVGLLLASVGLVGIVWGVIHANELGWGSTSVLGSIAAGFVFLGAFGWWEARSDAPMLPLRFFRDRTFFFANAASFLMFFGVFGAVFLMTQFLQFVQGYSPFEAGLRTLPWTGMPAIVAPIAGAVAGRIGGRPLLVAGLALMAIGLGWFAAIATPDVAYSAQVPALVLAGVGMGLFFAPVAAVVLSSVKPSEEGKASGATNAIRELGGVFGVAVLAAVFAGQGSYFSGQAFVDGMVPAIWVGAIIVGIAAMMAALIPGRKRTPQGVAEPIIPAPAASP